MQVTCACLRVRRHMYVCPHTRMWARPRACAHTTSNASAYVRVRTSVGVQNLYEPYAITHICVPTICASRACTGGFTFSVLCWHQDVMWEFSCTCLCVSTHRWVRSRICRLARVGVRIHMRKRVCIYVLAVVFADLHNHACT